MARHRPTSKMTLLFSSGNNHALTPMIGRFMNTFPISRLLPMSLLACATGNPGTKDTARPETEHAVPSDTEDTGIIDADTSEPEDTDTPDSGGEDDPPVLPAEVDYRLSGPHTTTTTTVTLSASCSASTKVVTPSTPSSWPRVFLSHGFMRGPSQMIGWAEHMATWGIEVVVPTLCHASILDTDHVQNGSDLTQFNDAMGGGPVVYVGHSAGGLASLVAAAEDDDTIGFIGLDLTDADGLGGLRAGDISAPTLAVVGEAGACNAEGNGVDAVQAVAGSTILRLSEADHCDFENETNLLCTALCSAPGSVFSDDDIHDALLGLSLTEEDLDAEAAWWRAGGVFYDDLNSRGAVLPL